MTIAFLKPTAVTDTDSNIGSGTVGDVDEGVSGADANRIESVQDHWSGAKNIDFTMEDLPGGASSINSVKLRVRGGITQQGEKDDSASYAFSVIDGNLSGNVQFNQADDGAGWINRVTTLTGSPSVSDVNACKVRWTNTIVFEQGEFLDQTTCSLDAFELEVDYDSITSALGTSTSVGTLSAIGQSIQAAVGVSTISGDIASNGEHTSVTAISLITGNLAGSGTGLVFALGTITISATLASTAATNAYGTVTILGEGISEGVHNAFAVSSFIGQLIAGGGVTFAFATITVSGDLAAVGQHNIVTATNTFSGSLSASATAIKFATATSTITGDLVSAAAHKVNATITVLGEGLSEGIHLAAGTITITGDLVADGLHLVAGTSTFIGDLSAIGIDTTDETKFAAGTSPFIGELDANPVSRAFGTITISGDLASSGTSMARGTITVLGEGLSEAIHLAAGTITITGDLVSSGTKIVATKSYTATYTRLSPAGVSMGQYGSFSGKAQIVTAAGTITVIGDLAGVATAIKFAVGTNTIAGDLSATATAIKFAVGTITIAGDLASTAATNTYGTITVLGEGLSEAVHIAAGTITVTGDLVAASGSSFAFGTSTITGDLAVGGGVSFAFGTSTIVGDLNAIGIDVTQTIKYAAGTSSFIGDLAAVGEQNIVTGTSTFSGQLISVGTAKKSAAGTITVTGDLAGDGANMARGTITVLGEGLSEGIHLAAGTITIAGDLVAENGTSFAFGTSTITGDLAALATGIVYPTATITITGESVSRGTSLGRGTITALGEGLSEATHLAAGTVTAIGEMSAGTDISLFAFGTSTFSGSLAAAGLIVGASRVTRLGLYGGPRPIYGQFSAKAQAPTSAVGTITFIGSVSANGEHNVVTGTITASAQVAASGTQLAGGSILASGQLVAVGTTIARGTITVLGQGLSEAVHLASGTITAIGDVAGIGVDVGASLAFGTSTIFGELAARAGHAASATSTIAGDLVSSGVIFVAATTASGLISISLRLDGDGNSFCPITAVGSISVSASLSAIEDESDDIVPASGFIHVSGQLRGELRHYTSGGNILAHGTITIKGDVPEAEIRKVSCIRPTATITILGGTLAAFGGDLNQKSAVGTISFIGGLGISAIYARSVAATAIGALTAYGRNLPIGDASLLAQESIFGTNGRIGSGTIDGQKKAVLRVAYGSIELYNNSQGGFYSIGSGAALKEAFGLINVTASLDAWGRKDQTQYRSGTITMIGDLDTTEPITSVTANVVMTATGSLVANGEHVGVTATITAKGDLVSVGDIVTVLTLDDKFIFDQDFGGGFAEARYKIDNDGNVYTWISLVGSWVQIFTLTNWIRPNDEAGSTYKVRATKISGSDPTNGALGTWQTLDNDRFWSNILVSEGSQTSTLLIEISIDEVEILASCSVTLETIVGQI